MKLTLKEIAKIVEGTLPENCQEIIIKGVAALEDATENDITVLYSLKFIKKIYTTKAAAVITQKNLLEQIKQKIKIPIIEVENAELAFIKLLQVIEKDKYAPEFKSEIHETAIISKSAKLSENVTVGPYTVIEENVSIGENTYLSANCYIGKNSTIGRKCFIYPQVVIRENVNIGDEVVIHSGTVIGSDGFGYFKTKENTHLKIPQIGTVEIGNNVEIGANVTIDRATTGKTVIGSGTKIDNLVQIGHNVKIGKNCIIVSQVGIAGSVKIGNNVTLAGQAGIADHVTICDGAIVAAQAGVIGDIKEGEIVSGYPARPHREALKIQAFINKLVKKNNEAKNNKK